MAKYRHPTIDHGTVSQGEDVYPIVDGLVECPPEFGVAAALTPVPDPVEDEKRKAKK